MQAVFIACIVSNYSIPSFIEKLLLGDVPISDQIAISYRYITGTSGGSATRPIHDIHSFHKQAGIDVFDRSDILAIGFFYHSW
jgi:hypothetical protein